MKSVNSRKSRGGSLVMDAGGQLIKEGKYFQEDFIIADLDQVKKEGSGHEPVAVRTFDKDMRVSRASDPDTIVQYLIAEKNIREIYQSLVLGIRDYFSKMGFTKAILGSSGGIDSAVTLALACDALGKEKCDGYFDAIPIFIWSFRIGC